MPLTFSRFLLVTFVSLIAGGCSQLPSRDGAVTASVDHLYQYQLTDSADRPLSLAQLLRQTRDADVIMVGEWHGHPGVHLFQAHLLAALTAQAQAANTELALSMEHFTRADQPVLDRYLAGEIGESGLMQKAKVWDNYKSDYRPLVEIARRNGLSVVAANAPRDIVRCVGREGIGYLAGLGAERRGLVAQTVDISDSAYRRKFLGFMSGGSSGGSLPSQRVNKMFGAQMTWDATMAESMVLHKRANPDAKILHVAGRFHVVGGLGTGAEMLKLEPELKIVYISAVSDDDPVEHHQDYRLQVQTLPPLAVSEEERKAMFHTHQRSPVDC